MIIKTFHGNETLTNYATSIDGPFYMMSLRIISEEIFPSINIFIQITWTEDIIDKQSHEKVDNLIIPITSDWTTHSTQPTNQDQNVTKHKSV